MLSKFVSYSLSDPGTYSSSESESSFSTVTLFLLLFLAAALEFDAVTMLDLLIFDLLFKCLDPLSF